MILNQFRFFLFLLNHPLNRRNRPAALGRYLRWQIGARLVPGDVVVPFVEDARLLVRPGMTGATGNIYTGLHEYGDMAFVLHLLRDGDLFVDVGANVGSYTVLAASACGARVIAIEPIPSTFRHLLDNIHLNAIEDKVEALNIGLGGEGGQLLFTAESDTTNHVISPDEDGTREIVRVPVKRLDDCLKGKEPPVLIKVDVEGFETEVVKGAESVLQNDGLLAVIMELNGSGERYGFDEQALHARMLDFGFEPCRYDPASRSLKRLEGKNSASGNTLYVRHHAEASKRLKTARRYRIRAVGVEL